MHCASCIRNTLNIEYETNEKVIWVINWFEQENYNYLYQHQHHEWHHDSNWNNVLKVNYHSKVINFVLLHHQNKLLQSIKKALIIDLLNDWLVSQMIGK